MICSFKALYDHVFLTIFYHVFRSTNFYCIKEMYRSGIWSTRVKFQNAAVVETRIPSFITMMTTLTHIRPILHSYRNQSINLQFKLIGWFLCECNIDLIWVNHHCAPIVVSSLYGIIQLARTQNFLKN